MVITKPKGDPFCGVARYCMSYVLARGHVILSNGWLENMTAKLGERCCKNRWDSKISERSDINIFSVIAPLAMKFCGGVCKDMKHIVIEGDGHWSDETTRTCTPISSSAAAGQQGQREQRLISLSSLILWPRKFIQACATA
jgi:hypothetical protein